MMRWPMQNVSSAEAHVYDYVFFFGVVPYLVRNIVYQMKFQLAIVHLGILI